VNRLRGGEKARKKFGKQSELSCGACSGFPNLVMVCYEKKTRFLCPDVQRAFGEKVFNLISTRDEATLRVVLLRVITFPKIRIIRYYL